MKKSLLAIVLAAATLPLTFAQTPAPAQNQPEQKSTATKPAKKTKKHSTKKTTGSAKKTSTTSNPPQK